MDMNIWSESILERDLEYFLEYDSNVVSYRAQAARIFYELDGKRRHYTPDFLCERRNQRPQIIEVKYRKELSKLGMDEFFRMIYLICEREGYEFLVYTELEIRVQPRLNNIKTQWKYSRVPLTPYHQVLCDEFFTTEAEVELQQVYEFFAGKNIDKQVVLALLYHGFLSTDLNIPLGVNSPIRYQALRQPKEVV
jgi:hypothetical protein